MLLFSYGMRVGLHRKLLAVRARRRVSHREGSAGRFLAKLSVSALLFDYVLTGPISGVSAGQYIVGLDCRNAARDVSGVHIGRRARDSIKHWGSVAIACAATLYFLRQNLLGIHESSGKALKIMIATTVMAVVLLGLGGRDAVAR